jgi:hypothetical protein
MRRLGHVAFMRVTKNAYKMASKPERLVKCHLEHLRFSLYNVLHPSVTSLVRA